ncbi:NAD-dependent epimerase/dehydratase family protein [Neolewinella aurantiaca]|uniref:NAD-dependent epimerase/dehydratase family protein n=1 Tax=Neolewinella aurantiaca TaxID=2602767 RepID=A0A5C7F4Z7_9BACT|nr:NAD-dependent epimerase/dehydratase family protein [Neolewinella aurantiaca]TXF85662.1 NAD-dependent epimerase/dehydratase family protein [Neolewinella aurantiaca]
MILLTGGTGFLGRRIAQALNTAQLPFRALARETSDVSALKAMGPDVEIVEGDLNDPESLLDACAGIDTIIHAAAFVSFQTADRERLLFVNGEGTANLVNMALEAGVRRLIHISSVAVLNRRDGGPVVTLAERWPEQRPNTSYAESKFAAEREVWRGQAEGLEVAVLYPTHMLASGDWEHEQAPRLWRMAAKERGVYPTGTTGFIDLRDVVDATLFVLDRDQDGDRFLLNAVNWTWEEAMTRIAGSIGAKPPTIRVKPWQSALLWPIELVRSRISGSKPMITRESHQNVQADFRYDGSAYKNVSERSYRSVEACVKEVGAAWQHDQANS